MSGSPPVRLNVRVSEEVIWVKRRIVGSMLAWLAAVATVAGIASIAIGAAGRQVRPQLLASSSPLAVPPAVQSTPVTVGGTSSYGEASTEVPATGGPGPAGPVGDNGSPVLHERAVRAAGGRVHARCTGRQVAGYALPDDGWQARISATARRRLEVVFSFGTDRAVLVTAVCEAGGPTFRQSDLDPRHPIRRVPVPTAGTPTPSVTQISPTPTSSTTAPGPTKTGKPTPSGTPSSPTPTGYPSSTTAPPASIATSTTSSSATSSAEEAPQESPSASRTTSRRSGADSGDLAGDDSAVSEQCPIGPTPTVPSATPSDSASAATGLGLDGETACEAEEPEDGPLLGM